MADTTEAETENNDEEKPNIAPNAPRNDAKGKPTGPVKPKPTAADALAAHAAALDAAEFGSGTTKTADAAIPLSQYDSTPSAAYLADIVLPELRSMTLNSPVEQWVVTNPRFIRTAFGSRTVRQDVFNSSKFHIEQLRLIEKLGLKDLPLKANGVTSVHEALVGVARQYFITPIVNPMDLHSKLNFFSDGSDDYIPIFPCTLEDSYKVADLMYKNEPGLRRNEIVKFASRLRAEPNVLQEIFVATNAAFAGATTVPVGFKTGFMHRQEYLALLPACREFLTHCVTYDAHLAAVDLTMRTAAGVGIIQDTRHLDITRSRYLFRPFSSVRLPNHEQYDLLRTLHDKRCLGSDMYNTVRGLVSTQCGALLSNYTVASSALENFQTILTNRTATSANSKYTLRLGTSLNMQDFYLTIFTWYICGRGIEITLSPTPDLPDLDLMMYIVLRCFVPSWAVRYNSEYMARLAPLLAGAAAWVNTPQGAIPGIVTQVNAILANNNWRNVAKTVAVGPGVGINSIAGMPALTQGEWDGVVTIIGNLFSAMDRTRSTQPVAMKALALIKSSSMLRSADLGTLFYEMRLRAEAIGDRFDTHAPFDYTALAFTVQSPGPVSVLTIRPEGIISALVQTLKCSDHDSLKALSVDTFNYTKNAVIYRGVQQCRAEEAHSLWTMVCWLLTRYIDVFAAVRAPLGWYNARTEYSADEQDLLAHKLTMTIVTECFENSDAVAKMITSLITALGGMRTPLGGPATALGTMLPLAVRNAVRPLYVPTPMYWEPERLPAYPGFTVPAYPGLGYITCSKRLVRVALTKLSRCTFMPLFPPTLSDDAAQQRFVPYVLVYNSSTSPDREEWDEDDDADALAPIVPAVARNAVVDPVHGYTVADLENSLTFHHSALRASRADTIRNVSFTAGLVLHDSLDKTLQLYLEDTQACAILCKAAADVSMSYHEVIGGLETGLDAIATTSHSNLDGISLQRMTGEGVKFNKFKGVLNVVCITTSDYHEIPDGEQRPVLNSRLLMDALIRKCGDKVIVAPTLSEMRNMYHYHHTTFGPRLDNAALVARRAAAYAEVDNPLDENAPRSFDGSATTNLDIVGVKFPCPLENHETQWSHGSVSDAMSFVRPFGAAELNDLMKSHSDTLYLHQPPTFTTEPSTPYIPSTSSIAMFPSVPGAT